MLLVMIYLFTILGIFCIRIDFGGEIKKSGRASDYPDFAHIKSVGELMLS